MMLFILLLSLAAISALLTWFLRRYALSHSLMDIPNQRSSHSIATPRGGGAAIVLTFLLALLTLALAGWAHWPAVIGMAGAGLLIAIVGFLDDHGSCSVSARLVAHFTSAVWVLFWLPELPTLLLFGLSFDLGWVGYGLLTVLLVWVLNLFNFMDGIDGIASVEAISVCLGGALLYVLLDNQVGAIVPLALAAVVAGFLCWNFPPARIFMGDVGSGFLGIILGSLLVQAAVWAPELFWAWLILLGVFVVDATFTLMRRLARGDRIHQAHRTHAYQYAARHFESHRAVTLAVLALNVFWLMPWALLAGLSAIDGLIALLVAYVPLICLAFLFNAGAPEQGVS